MTKSDRLVRVAIARASTTNGELRRLLDEKAISQRELGEGLGVSAQAVNSWLTGKSSPSFEVALRLADLLERLADVVATS